MNDTPAQPPSSMEPMPLDMTRTDQRFVVNAGTAADGSRMVLLAIFQPLVTHVVALDRQAAVEIAAQIREAAGGLTIPDGVDIGPNGRSG